MRLWISSRGFAVSLSWGFNKFCLQRIIILGIGREIVLPQSRKKFLLNRSHASHGRSFSTFVAKTIFGKRVWLQGEYCVEFNSRQYSKLKNNLALDLTHPKRVLMNDWAKKQFLHDGLLCGIRNQLSAFTTKYREKGLRYVSPIIDRSTIPPAPKSDKHPVNQSGGEDRLITEMSIRAMEAWGRPDRHSPEGIALERCSRKKQSLHSQSTCNKKKKGKPKCS